MRSWTSSSFLLALVAAAACATSPPAATMSAPGAGPTDAQIAAIVGAANTVDIEAGELAKSKSTNATVKAFAERMVADHTAVNQQATALVTKLGVTPEESDTSRALKQGGDANLQKLRGLEGAAFDRAYAENEVTYHEAVIQAVDTALIPHAQNAELSALLKAVRPALVAHLEHAKQIRDELADGTTTSSAAHHGGGH